MIWTGFIAPQYAGTLRVQISAAKKLLTASQGILEDLLETKELEAVGRRVSKLYSQ